MAEQSKMFHPVTGCLAGAFLLLIAPALLDGERLSQRRHSGIHDGAATNDESSVANRDPASGGVKASNPATTGPDPQRTQNEPGNDPREYAFFGDRLAQGWMTLIGGLGLLLSGATIYLIARTVKLQRDATEHALSAAAAGWESANATKASVAAYVHATACFVPAKDPAFANALGSVMRDMTARLILRMKNIGSTVAKNVEVRFELVDEPYADGFEFRELSGPPKLHTRRAANIAPTQEPEVTLLIDVLKAVETSKNVDPLRAPDGPFPTRSIRGEIIYDDVFGNTFRSAFLYQLHWPEGQKGPFSEDNHCWTRANKAPVFQLIASATQRKQ